ncbi:MAG: GNAT family N-acetyltransferase [Anaerolineae bacterium]
MIRIENSRTEYAEALAGLQQAVFPTLSADEWFSAAMYRKHIEVFPQGQFLALAHNDRGEEVLVGATTTFRTSFDFANQQPPFYFEFTGGGYLTTHEPDGVWLYGVDISVHPDFRRMGIGSRLYDARRELVKRLNLRGELVAGLMPGYPQHRAKMSVEEYAQKVAAGELLDPTLTMQLENDFKLWRVLRGYVHDARSDDCATLIVRQNEAYKA